MFHVKYLSSSLYDIGEDFLSFFFWLPWQPQFFMGIVLKELDARNIHTKFYQIWPSGLGGKVILMKKFTDVQTTDITV